MPARKSGAVDTSRNSSRRNGKKWKQHPGVTEASHPGRTQDGYSPAKLGLRAAKRKAA